VLGVEVREDRSLGQVVPASRKVRPDEDGAVDAFGMIGRENEAANCPEREADDNGTARASAANSRSS
jgi:hypothetical protein